MKSPFWLILSMGYKLTLDGPTLNAPKHIWFHVLDNFLNMELLYGINVLFCGPAGRHFLRSATSHFGVFKVNDG